MLSNVEFEKLYKQFEPMIIKLVHKWSKLGVIEYDDLMQFALLALIDAAKTYDETKGTKFSAYVYTIIEYRLRREIYSSKMKNRISTISINSTVTSVEGSTAELIETIADDLNLEEEIKDKLMLDYYKKECRRVLGNDFKIAYLKWFQNMSCKAIESILSIDKASYRVNNCRRKLIQKSSVFNKEYMKINGISDYNTEKMALYEA